MGEIGASCMRAFDFDELDAVEIAGIAGGVDGGISGQGGHRGACGVSDRVRCDDHAVYDQGVLRDDAEDEKQQREREEEGDGDRAGIVAPEQACE